MELYESFNEFVNEGIKFGKKGIEQRIKDSIEYCEQQLEAGDKWMKEHIDSLKDVKPNRLNFKAHTRLYSPKRGDFEVFNPNSSKLLAGEIAKVIKKYKGDEVEQSSTAASAGWSGTMRATVGGSIQPRVNFNNGSNFYVIGVTIGSGIDDSTRDKIMQELYELFFVFEEWNSSNGGIQLDHDNGSNYSTIGLQNRKLGFSKGFAKLLEDIMNGV